MMRVFVSRSAANSMPADFDLHLIEGENLNIGTSDLEAQFGATLTSLEKDLLLVASAVFVADIACKRGMRENINRAIEIDIPVVNHAALNAQRLALEHIVHVLSDDNWSISLRREEGTPEAKIEWPRSTGKTLLFSGGLDSLAAAVDLLEESGTDNLLLASHITHNSSTIRAQRELVRELETAFGEKINRIELRTGPKSSEDYERPTDDPEVSQRTRSFMFLAIAAISARRHGMNEIVYIAENGQMAIHLPLSAARIGAFSTHTAHPEFVSAASAFFTSVLDHVIRIDNPFLYKTKAEVVANLAQNYKGVISNSNSCWKNARIGGHCGTCIPCCIRRIALESHGIAVDSWKRDLFGEAVASLPSTDEAKRNLTELAEFVMAFSTSSDAQLDLEYPEINSRFFDRALALAMYRRFATEANQVWSRYPNLNHLMM